MPKILFRADTYPSIGTGDLMSVIYLARYLSQRSWDCYFMVKKNETAERLLQRYAVRQAIYLPFGADVNEEIALIRTTCDSKKIDCLFLEITDRRLDEYETLGRAAPVQVCANFDGEIIAGFDLVINWAVAEARGLYDSKTYPHTRFLLGFENAPMPVWAYRNGRKRKKKEDSIRNILVTMGGADEFNLTRKVVTALRRAALNCRVTVVAGAGYERYDGLKRLLEKSSSRFVIKRNVKEMRREYESADLAISAGGLTAMELALAGVPTLLIAAYEHQKERCQFLARKEVAHYLGTKDDVETKDIASGIRSLCDSAVRLRKNLRRFHLQSGGERIFRELTELWREKLS